MIHLGEFLSSRCPVWYTRGSSSDCSSHLKPMWSFPGMRHRYGGDLLKKLQGRKDDIPLVIGLESNYVAFWIDNLIFFGCVLNCSLSFTPLNLFQHIFLHTPTRSFWTFSEQVEVYQFFLWSSLLFVAALHPVRILSQRCTMPSFVAPFPPPSALVSSSISSLRFTLAVRLSKPFWSPWTHLSLCVMALRTGIKDKRGLVEPLYWF